MPRQAAIRVLEELARAAKGNYYRHGWGGYIDRADVEKCALAALDPTEAAVYRRLIEESARK